MASNYSPSPPHRKKRRRYSPRGNCRLWLKMQDDRHEKAANFWADARHKGDISKEVAQLKKAKIRMDLNPKYPGAVGVAIIYYHQNGDAKGTPIASFTINDGWKEH